MKKSSSCQNKINNRIIAMQNSLISKLSALEYERDQKPQQGLGEIMMKKDCLSNLIQRANSIRHLNWQKIQDTKKALQKSKRQQNGSTFVTGLGLYSVEPRLKRFEVLEPEIDHNHLLKELQSKEPYDDLAELRRMIKQTGQSLQQYGKGVSQVQKQVLNAADKFNPHLSYKLNQIQRSKSPHKFKSSVNLKPIINHRYA